MVRTRSNFFYLFIKLLSLGYSHILIFFISFSLYISLSSFSVITTKCQNWTLYLTQVEIVKDSSSI